MRSLTRAGSVALSLAVLTAAPIALAEGEKNVTPLEKNIAALEKNITPMETVTTEGDTTEISLQADILFEFGSAELTSASPQKIADLVKDVPDGAEIQVDGHTDDIPFSGEGGNQKLSEDRAQAVADAITDARPDLKPTVAGHADSQPVETPSEDDASAARAKNRRVEISYGG